MNRTDVYGGKSVRASAQTRTVKKNLLKHRVLASAALAAAVGLFQGAARAADTWNGGAGNWNTPGSWSAGVPNSASTDVAIDGGNASNSAVTLDISATIKSLTLDAGDSLNISNSRGLTLASGATINGIILLSSTANSTILSANGAQTFSGSGQIKFDGTSSSNFINGNGPLTIGSGVSVRTAAQGGTLNVTTLNNQGLISSETSGRTLNIGSTTFTSSGMLQASDGTLSITATSWTNSGTLSISGNGVVNLGGTFTSAGLGTISRTGGTINLTGVLDNTSATLALTAATGSFNFTGGTLRGGTVTAGGGSSLILAPSTSGKFDGIEKLDADVTVANAAGLTVTNGLNLASGRSITLGSIGNSTVLTFTGAQTLSGAGQVLLGGSGSGNFMNGSGPLTIANGVNIHTAGQGGTISVTTLTNQGVISAETAGKTLTISSTSFTNAGTAQVSDGTLAITSAGWTNTGSLSVSGNGLLQLGGTFTSAGLGNISRSGGTIDLTGVLDNSNATLALSAATGSINLRGGTLRGGTVTAGGGAALVIPASASAAFDGIAKLDSDIVINNAAGLTVTNGLNLAAGRTVTLGSNGNSTVFTFNGAQTLSGAGQVLLGGTSSSNFINGSGPLTIANGISIRTAAQGGIINNSTVVNQGLISAETAGKTLTISSANFTNTGMTQVSDGTLAITSTSWTNTGTIGVSANGLLQLGGTFTSAGLGTISRSGGTIDLTGTLDNTNATFAINAATGSINLRGGTLRGGTVTAGGGASLLVPASASGALDGVNKLDTDLTINNAAGLTITNGLGLASGRTITLGSVGNATVLTFNGAQTLSGSGQVAFAGSNSNNFINGSGPLTLGPSMVVRTGTQGGSISVSTLINQGTISAEVAGKTLTISSASFTNAGMAKVSDGTLAITSTSWTNSGTISVSGNGLLQLGGKFTSAGLGTVARTGGTIDLTGTLENTGATFALSASTGSINLRAGTLHGGTVTASGGAELLIPVSTSGSLDGVENLNIDLTINNAAGVTITNGLGLGSGHTVTLVSNGNATVMTFTGSQTLSGGGQVLFGGSNSNNFINGSGPLTIAAGISVRTGAQGGTINVGGLLNQGLISAELPGKTLAINSSVFTNGGTAQASDGTLAINSQSWSNTGTLGVSGNGLLQLGGSFTTAGLGTVSRTGGSIELTGMLDNTSATFALTAATGSISIHAGTIKGGTITATGGAVLSITGGSNANFDGVVNLNTDFVVPNATSLSVSNGLGIASGHSLTLASAGNGASLSANGVQTFSGSGQIAFGGTGGFDLITGSGTLTVAPSFSIRTDTQGGTINISTLINQGLISAQTPAKTLTIGSGNFMNTGAAQVSDGTLAITSASWTNTGTLGVSGNGLLQLGGNFTTAAMGTIARTGGTIEITGTLDNTNATLPLATTGTIKLHNGTLRGGTVTTGGGAVLGLVANATFDGDVRLDTDVASEGGATPIISNTLSLVNGHSFNFISNQTFSGSGQFLFAGSSGPSIINGTGSLSIASTLSLRTAGQGGTINTNTIFNQGLISAETAGKTLTINTIVNNNGTVRAQAGGTLIINGGLAGNGAGITRVDTGSTLQAGYIRSNALTLVGNAGDPASFAHLKFNTKAQGGGTSLLKTPTLPTDASSNPLYFLDIADTALAIDYNAGSSPIAVIRQALMSGRAGGAWNGPGITSSSIPGHSNTGLGVAESSDVLGAAGGTFAGLTVDGSAVLIRYTLLGDANVDGSVSFPDLVRVAQNYGISNGSATWAKGDFNGDGNVTFQDLVSVAQNYGGVLPAGAIPGAPADFQADAARAFSEVPEPLAAPALLTFALLGATRRRRRV